MNTESEPSQKKEKTTNPSLSFFSLPDDIIMNCIARISTSYYPKLSLVSKTFASLISSYELHETRFLQKTHEEILHVCLQFSNNSGRPSWFSLWLKPNQTLTNDLGEKEVKSTGNALLVPIPSSYCPRSPTFMCTVGSKSYLIINQNCYQSSDLSATKSRYHRDWRKVPNMMTVAREDPIAGVFDGKIYVMGGCSKDECKNWAEVFDTNTQTWESLPDPGVGLRHSPLTKLEAWGEKISVITSENNKCGFYVYDTEKGRWEVIVGSLECSCVIENVRYSYGNEEGFFCYTLENGGIRRRVVNGLSVLEKHFRGASCKVEMANYSGELLMIWDTFVHETNIWCALVTFERRNGDEVWGKVEWANSVLTVPNSCVLLRHVIESV